MNTSSAATSARRTNDGSLDVRPITPTIGAEIQGVRLSGDLPAATVTAVRDALLRPRPLLRGMADVGPGSALSRPMRTRLNQQ